MKHTEVKSFVHAFFIIKEQHYYNDNKQIINDFIKKPGLYHIAEKRDLDVELVYNIVKSHNMNILNVNIIKLMEHK